MRSYQGSKQNTTVYYLAHHSILLTNLQHCSRNTIARRRSEKTDDQYGNTGDSSNRVYNIKSSSWSRLDILARMHRPFNLGPLHRQCRYFSNGCNVLSNRFHPHHQRLQSIRRHSAVSVWLATIQGRNVQPFLLISARRSSLHSKPTIFLLQEGCNSIPIIHIADGHNRSTEQPGRRSVLYPSQS